MITSLIVAILVLVIFYYIIGLVPDENLRSILKVVVAIFFLIWLIGLITGRNYLRLNL